MMIGVPAALLSSGGIRRFLQDFLQEHFQETKDLSSLPSLSARLKCECDTYEEELLQLKKRLSLAFSSWISQSTEVERILSGIECGLSCPSRDGTLKSHGEIIHVDLPLLAKEVGRIQSVRLYAETALRLEALVGDLEDAALSMTKQVSRKKFENNLSISSNQFVPEDCSGFQQEYILVAITALKDIDEVLATVTNERPRWINLLKAIDTRVEKALCILRPQCLSDHRTLVASLGWPPSLSTTNVEKDKRMEVPNPLSLMRGQKKDKYCLSFLVLCSLQHLQAKREARMSFLQRNQMAYNHSDLKDMDEVSFFKHGLWAIDELVKLITTRMEHHFSKWLDQPKFIFALVYGVTRNFIDGVEEILQPLIDKAMLPSCSAKEAWVVSMVKMLSGYLENQIFPVIAKNYRRRNVNTEVNLLQMIDLMITFDKQMRILATFETYVEASFAAIEGFAPGLSIMSIFYEHSDWLQMWAEMEVDDAEGKLTPQMNAESSWSVVLSKQAGCAYDEEESFIFLCREDYKAPLIAESVIRLAQEMIERGSSLPFSIIRKQFLISSVNLFLSRFFSTLLQRTRDVEYMAAVLDDPQLSGVCSSMNAARYCEHVLREWSENVNLTENSFYEDGASFLAKLQTDCLEEIVAAILLHFDNLCWNYVRDSNWWAIDGVGSDYSISDEDYLLISPTFMEALDMLRDRIQFLKLNLNFPDFLDLWRSIAGGLDHYIFTSIPMSDAGFSSLGVHQFRTDMKALFLTFRPFCGRPEAFFPCIRNSLKLLEVGKQDSDQMLELMLQGCTGKDDWLRRHGIFHVSPAQAEKVLRNRMRA